MQDDRVAELEATTADEALSAGVAALGAGDPEGAVRHWLRASSLGRESGDFALSRHAQTLVAMHSASEEQAISSSLRALEDSLRLQDPVSMLAPLSQLVDRVVAANAGALDVAEIQRAAMDLISALDAATE